MLRRIRRFPLSGDVTIVSLHSAYRLTRLIWPEVGTG